MTITPINGQRGSARSGSRPSTRSGARSGAPRQLKSPLAAPGSGVTGPGSAGGASSDGLAAVGPVPLDDRESTIAEFEGYLRTVNNRDGRPYEERTINAYVFPAKNLAAWMTANGIEGDFTEADTALLNRYFREYYLEHGQGGTHTLQRNLLQLFNFLEQERDHPNPYTTGGLNRYAAVKGRPKTLSAEPTSSTTSWRYPAAARPGTSPPPGITQSSGSCARRASAAANCSAWS